MNSRWDHSYCDRGLCAASERLPAEAPVWSHTAVHLTVPVPEPHCCGVQSALPLAPTDAWQLPHRWKRDSVPSVHIQHLYPHPLWGGEVGWGLLNPTSRTGNGTMRVLGENLISLTSALKEKKKETLFHNEVQWTLGCVWATFRSVFVIPRVISNEFTTLIYWKMSCLEKCFIAETWKISEELLPQN